MPNVGIVVSVVQVWVVGILRILNAGIGIVAPRRKTVVRDIVKGMAVSVSRLRLEAVAEVMPSR